MKHNNIAIFIPHAGCTHECSFCNQKVISGTASSPSSNEIKVILKKAMDDIADKSNTEIAFFGGSFTAINRKYMLELLKTANEFIGENKFKGIRISTRPDAINQEILDILKNYNVTSIELGAQSMVDEVLKLNNRGHSASEIRVASQLIKENGFELGLQMMVGLYKDLPEGAYYTCDEIIKLKPKTVRIYPTVILKDTLLEKLYTSGEYNMMTLEQAVEVCSKLLLMFELNVIKVIKLGLHSSTDVQNDMVGGIYHPAFRELCEGELFFDIAKKKIMLQDDKKVVVLVNPDCISKMIGQKKINIEKFVEMGYNVRVASIDKSIKLDKYDVIVKKDVQSCF